MKKIFSLWKQVSCTHSHPLSLCKGRWRVPREAEDPRVAWPPSWDLPVAPLSHSEGRRNGRVGTAEAGLGQRHGPHEPRKKAREMGLGEMAGSRGSHGHDKGI